MSESQSSLCLRGVFMAYWEAAPPSVEVFYFPDGAQLTRQISHVEAVVLAALERNVATGRCTKVTYIAHAAVQAGQDQAEDWRVLSFVDF